MSKETYAAATIGRRLLRLANEHGTPNRFTPSEVMPESPMTLGRFLSDPVRLSYVNRGLRLHGMTVTYADRTVTIAALLSPGQ